MEAKAGVIAAHADWSISPAKRWIAVARRVGDAWIAQAPRPVGDTALLLPALLAEGAPVALGLDLPLGVPRDWVAARPEPGFSAFLAGLAQDPGFFEVSPTLDTVSPARPFYPSRGVKGMTRAAHAAALGLASAQSLSRLCDRATALRPAGAPVFWTLGANQSGKAAIAAWRDWIVPALAAGFRGLGAAAGDNGGEFSLGKRDGFPALLEVLGSAGCLEEALHGGVFAEFVEALLQGELLALQLGVAGVEGGGLTGCGACADAGDAGALDL